MHVMKRAIKASKDGSKSVLAKPHGTYCSFVKYLAQAPEVPPSPTVPAAEGTTSLVALLEPCEVQWFSQSLNFPVPGTGELLSSFQQTESISHFLPLRLWRVMRKPDLSVTAKKAVERPELA